MKYSTPELVELGSAATLVLGVLGDMGDNPNPDTEHVIEGIPLGLDD